MHRTVSIIWLNAHGYIYLRAGNGWKDFEKQCTSTVQYQLTAPKKANISQEQQIPSEQNSTATQLLMSALLYFKPQALNTDFSSTLPPYFRLQYHCLPNAINVQLPQRASSFASLHTVCCVRYLQKPKNFISSILLYQFTPLFLSTPCGSQLRTLTKQITQPAPPGQRYQLRMLNCLRLTQVLTPTQTASIQRFHAQMNLEKQFKVPHPKEEGFRRKDKEDWWLHRKRRMTLSESFEVTFVSS